MRPAAIVAALLRGARWCLAFFEQDTQQSMTRLIAFVCGLAGAAVAIICAIKGQEQAATVAALIGGGAVGLLTRKKSPDATPEE